MQTWGKLGLGEIRVRIQNWQYSEEAVAASISRRLGLVWCGGPRNEGTALNRGRPESHHYAGTLGKPCRGGGYTPKGEIWFAIPSGE